MGAEQLTMTRRPVEVAPGFPESGPQLGVFDNGLATLDVPSRQSTDLLTDTEQLLASIDEIVPEPAPYRLGTVAVEAAGVERADKLPGELQTSRRFSLFLGGVTLYLSQRKEANPPEVIHRSSLDILHDAADSPDSREALLVDTSKHVAEIVGGVGEGMEIELPVDDATGETIWGGQTSEERQFHTLTAYTNMAPRIRAGVHAEALNDFRLADRYRDGQLAGKVVFDFSAVLEASREELNEWGFFVDPMACSLRSHQYVGNTYKGRSLFVAGVDQRQLPPRVKGETEAQEAARQERAIELRWDVGILRQIYELFGVRGAKTMTPAEILHTPLIADDKFDLVDMTMLYDVLAAERVEDETKTFFGSVELWQEIGSPAELTREHYEAHLQRRQERQAEHETLCQNIVNEQIRRRHEARTPREAADLKRQVTLEFVVERAGHDSAIDAERLGGAAADKIYAARERFALGDTIGGIRLIDDAKKVAKDPSCPIKDIKDRLKSDSTDGKDAEQSGECREVKDGDKVKCPHCRQIVRARVPKKGGAIYCTNKGCVAFKEV